MVSFNEIKGHSFLGVISRIPTLQVPSFERFDHLLEVHGKLPLPGGKTFWHDALKLYTIESFQNL